MMIQLLLAFLVTATAWTDPVQTYVFFAKVNGTLKPLHSEGHNNSRQHMIWDDPSANSSEFYYKDGRALSSNESNPGNITATIYDDFHLDPTSEGNHLILDTRKSLRNSFFFWCSHPFSHLKIVYSHRYDSTCFMVEIYFLPYNRTTKAPINGSYTPEKEVERVPYVLFIEGKHDLEPLYSETLDPITFWFVPFNHGNPAAEPLEFFFQEDYAITESAGTMSGYLGTATREIWTQNRYFGFGRGSMERTLHLDSNMKFSRQRSFSCNDSRTVDRTILLNPSIANDCYEVEIYLLPYNRTNRRPMEGSYRSKNKTVPTNSSLAINSPYVFFVTVNNTLKPLSYFTEVDLWLNRENGVFFYQESWATPVELSFKNGIAYTQNTTVKGFVDTDHLNLDFDSLTPQTPLNLDKRMKMIGKDFYSCPKDRKSTERNVIRYTKRMRTCFKVDVYLLSYNRSSGRPMEGSYVPENDTIPMTAVVSANRTNVSIADIHEKPAIESGSGRIAKVFIPGIYEDPSAEMILPGLEEPIPEKSVPEESVPEESVPEKVVPEVSVPKESVPEESVPEESVPEETIPDEVVPEETIPDKAVPEESALKELVTDEIVPDESVPEEAVPEDAVPEEVVPDEAVPDEVVPDEVVPDEVVPDEVVPDESVPEEAVPEKAVPDEVVPDESVPEEAVPEKAVPEEAVPDEVVPEKAVPEKAVPDEVVPDEVVPDEVVPEESAPKEIVPEESAPEEVVPEEPVPEEPVPDIHIDLVSEDLENQLMFTSSYPDFPYVFFRKVRKGWVPLSIRPPEENDSNTYFSSSESESAPVEFTLKNGVAYTDSNSTRMYAGFHGSFFGYGVSDIQKKFKFDTQKRIQNHHFYRCKQLCKFNDLIVSPKIPNAQCKGIDIYLLSYNKTSGLPIEHQFEQQADTKETNSSMASNKLFRYLSSITPPFGND